MTARKALGVQSNECKKAVNNSLTPPCVIVGISSSVSCGAEVFREVARPAPGGEPVRDRSALALAQAVLSSHSAGKKAQGKKKAAGGKAGSKRHAASEEEEEEMAPVPTGGSKAAGAKKKKRKE